MTALRQELVDIVELVPEDKIFSLLQYIRNNINSSARNEITRKRYSSF